MLNFGSMRIALIGYGKMGHIIEQTAVKRGHEIVCIIDPVQSVEPSALLSQVTDERGFDTADFATADVAIEFTSPLAAQDNICRAWAKHVPVVSGTTGWDVDSFIAGHADDLQTNALVWSSNYSIGVNIFFAINHKLAEMMSAYSQYTPSITEVHHIHKLDKPSGTAKTMLKDIQSVYPKDIDVQSVREGEVPGIHTVKWESSVDDITLTHSAKSREGFALGAVLAAEWLKGKCGFYTMNEILGL